MNIKMNNLIGIISGALDVVENELFGETTGHGKRIASLVAAMGRHLNFGQDDLIILATGALFHDNALTEYILSERPNPAKGFNMARHCIVGQRNIEKLIFNIKIPELILYHHEQADGSGPFGKKEGECPLEAELITIADSLDVKYKLQDISVEDLPALRKDIETKTGSVYTKRTSEAMLCVLDPKMLRALRDDVIEETYQDLMPAWTEDIECLSVMRLAEFLSCIVDYKSEFTKKHSQEIAQRLLIMSDFYKFDPITRAKAYLAASFHDIGKMKTPTSILEKSGKLTDTEFKTIQEHVYHTYKMLKDIEGLEDICDWASNHHEKLDGTGYPFGKKAVELDFISRLMAIIDIYQAVSEERPYHPARSHSGTMPILFNMAKNGFIDAQIVKDIDIAMENYLEKIKDITSLGVRI